MNTNYDFVVIGSGLVGLSVAYQLKVKNPDSKVLILEKESDVAMHQSGHNSGVIHSGIYYKPGSLKAENCVNGYKQLIAFAQKHDIPYEICGKLIVAVTKDEVAQLKTISQKGAANLLTGITLLGAEQIKEMEPHCAGLQALHVPQTGIIDYPAMAKKLLSLFQQLGGEINFNKNVTAIKTQDNTVSVTTSTSNYQCKQLICCAGLFSDRVANYSENNNDLRIIPFRGEYYMLKPEKQHLVKNLIYPVPNFNFPFLGVHFTRMIHGGVEAGPNAVLAFKREGYKFGDFSAKDCLETATWPGFWKIVAKYGKAGMGEFHRSLSKSAFTKALQALVPEIKDDDLISGGAGVRAQACDRKGFLLDDFNIIRQNQIIHIRNAPSPAATSCLSISNHVINLLNIA